MKQSAKESRFCISRCRRCNVCVFWL